MTKGKNSITKQSSHPLIIEMTDFFKALSDPTRLSLIIVLKNTGSMCVCDLIKHLKQPQPTISRHLNHLHKIGILNRQRKGTWVWYDINQNLPLWCEDIIDIIISHKSVSQ